VALLPLASAPAAFAEKGGLTLLGGQYSGSKLLELGGSVEFKDSYTVGLSVSYQFVDWGTHIRWELEGQMLNHIEQDHV
jgi:hypothetical protein